MSSTETKETNKKYYSIAQGEFVLPVPKGTDGSRVRAWEAGGRSGEKTELPFRSLTGYITGVNFYQGEVDGSKFTNLNITLDQDENGKTPVISIGVDTKYCKDIMKKLPKADLKEEIRFRPFSFTPDGEDKNITGVELLQRDGTGQFNKKVTSFFHKKEGEKWVATNSFPVPEGDVDTYTSDDWKVYGIQVKKFLMNYIQTHITPKFENAPPKTYEEQIARTEGEEEIKPEDIPF